MKRQLLAIAISVGFNLAACGGKAAPSAAAKQPAGPDPSGDSCCCEFIAEHGDEPTRSEYMPLARCAELGTCVEDEVCEADDGDHDSDADFDTDVPVD